jgi:hypothetical protein
MIQDSFYKNCLGTQVTPVLQQQTLTDYTASGRHTVYQHNNAVYETGLCFPLYVSVTASPNDGHIGRNM